MISNIKKYRFLLLRRAVQFTILLLFFGANRYHWNLLVGNLSSAKVLDSFYLADPFAVMQILATGTLITVDILVGAIIVLVFYALVTGRSFCSWVCPVNIITDFAATIRKKINIPKNVNYIKISQSFRNYIFILALILSLLTGIAAYEVINPIGYTMRGVVFGFGIGSIMILVSIFLFDLLVLKHGFCGYICPIGAFYGFVSRYRLLKVNLNNDKCTSCMDCKKVCPEVQVLDIIGKHSGNISQGACTNCGRCIEVCNDKALKFSLNINNDKSVNNA